MHTTSWVIESSGCSKESYSITSGSSLFVLSVSLSSARLDVASIDLEGRFDSSKLRVDTSWKGKSTWSKEETLGIFNANWRENLQGILIYKKGMQHDRSAIIYKTNVNSQFQIKQSKDNHCMWMVVKSSFMRKSSSIFPLWWGSIENFQYWEFC